MTRRHFAAVLTALAGSTLIAPPGLAAPDQPPSPISVQVQALNRTGSSTSYVLTVHNNLEGAHAIEVTQRFAQAPKGIIASDDGKLGSEGLTWVIEVPPKQPRAVSSEVTFAGSFTTRSTACIRDVATLSTLDCGTGDLAVGATEAGSGLTWLPVLLWSLLAAALAAGGYWLYRARRRWAPPARRFVRRHRNATAVAGAAVALVLVSATAFLYLTGRARSAIDLQDQPGQALGWEGLQSRVGIGLPAPSTDAEITLYRWSCAELEGGIPQCAATVAIRNTSAVAQRWFSRMQRLMYSDGDWIGADPDLTFLANGNSDRFAEVLAPQERRVAVLVYRPAPGKKLAQLELREGAFTRGVFYSVG